MNEEKRKQKKKLEEIKQKRLLEREEEKLRKQEEKARKKEEKELTAKKQKAEKELLSKKRLFNNPDHSIKLMNVIFDEEVEKLDFYTEFIKEIEKSDFKYSVTSQLIPQSITWNRNAEDYYINENQEVCSIEKIVDENQMVIIWSPEEIVTHISNDTLTSAISNITSIIPNKQITLVIYKIESYFKNMKNQKDKEPANKKQKKSKTDYTNLPKISRKNFEEYLIRIQLVYHINSRLIENEMEMVLLISQYTKAIALLPSKLEKKQQSSQFEWFIGYDNKDTVKVDKDGYGLKKLWQQQLCQFPLLSLEIAEAISSIYKSPLQLIKAYEKCNKTEGEILLRDIPIRRAAGPLTSVRKIGPELSKKIYIMFTSESGDTLLS